MPFDLEDRLTQTPKPCSRRRGSKGPSGDAGILQSSGDIRILILDDDPATCSVIQAALSNRDFQSTPSPTRCWSSRRPSRAHRLPPDRPGLRPARAGSRARCSRWIRDGQPDANIVVVTGYPSVDSALNCLRARTYDYLTKPFQVDQLREIVFRCLESKGLLRMTEEALREALGRRDPRAPQGPGADAVEHERPDRRVARLPEPDRAGQELGVDRDAVPHLPGAGDEDERTVPGRPAELR